jgi:hypothetical protein
LEIPYVGEYIGKSDKTGRVIPPRSRPGHDSSKPGVSPFGDGGEDNVDIYRNINGSGSYFVSNEDFPIPSCLDDVRILPSGVNSSWKTLTIGLETKTAQRFLVRWKVYWTYTSGFGAGISAFYPDPPAPNRDFGGYIELPEGTYLLTFNIAGVGCNTPQAQMYFVQQFRWPQFPERGEGPFASYVVQSVFSGFGPSIGSSENLFYYDWDPIDGIYDETEFDNFGTEPGEEANLALGIAASGSQETVLPTSFTAIWGVVTGGNLASLWSSDDNRLVIREAPPVALGGPSVRLLVEGGVSSSNIAGFEFVLESRVPVVGNAVTQTIELFNYVTNQWVLFDSRFATTTDSVIQLVVPNNPTHYISSQNRMRSRISFYDPGSLITFGWTGQVDQAIWRINYP